MNAISFEPLISPALWATLAVLSAASLAWYALRRVGSVSRRRWGGILALMAIGSAAVLFVLLNPTWLEPIPPPAGKPLLTVLADLSASMATKDVPGDRTRWSEAARIAQELEQKMAGRFDVQVRTFAATSAVADFAQLSSQQPAGDATDMALALAESIAADRPQGQALAVVGDGGHNASGGIAHLLEVVRTARSMAVPIYTVTVGGRTELRDVEVGVNRPQELAFVGQTVPISVPLIQRGHMADRIKVSLVEQGKVIDQKEAPLQPNGTTTVRFNVTKANSGLYAFEVRAAATSGEATATNNTGTVLLRVIEKPIRVLVLEGKPYWDAKFLIRTLAADPSLDVDSVVRLSSGRFLKRKLSLVRNQIAAAVTPPAAAVAAPGNVAGASPATEAAPQPVERSESSEIIGAADALLDGQDGWPTYQVLVLGRDSEAFLNEKMLLRLRDWIAHDGGSLVCFRGSPVARADQQLDRLLPVRWAQSRETRYRMKLTERGESLNWLGAHEVAGGETLGQLPSLAAVARPENTKPLAVVLATSTDAAGSPLVTYQPYGVGRVVAIEGAGMWRWAFLPPEFRKHDDVYGSIWQNLLRWLVSSVGLVPGQDMVLRADRVTYQAGESVTSSLLLRQELKPEEIPKIELSSGDPAATKQFSPVPYGDEPGMYQISFGRLPTGRYRAAVVGQPETADNSSAQIVFDVRESYAEQLDVAARPDVMARIAGDSGGAVIDSADAASVADQFEQHIAKTRPQRVRQLTAWDRWWILLGVVCVWGTAWGLRRSGGLI